MIKWLYSFAKNWNSVSDKWAKTVNYQLRGKKNEQTVKQRQSRLFISWLKKVKWNITEKKKKV